MEGREYKVWTVQFGLCCANRRPFRGFLSKGVTYSRWYFGNIWWGARDRMNEVRWKGTGAGIRGRKTRVN